MKGREYTMIIGIDLGTTFSAAAYVDEKGVAKIIPNRDGHSTTPSVVMFDDGEVVVGQQAKENAELAPGNVVQFVKRNMGNKKWHFYSSDDEEYSAEEISARILRRIVEDCEEAMGEKVTKAVISVPAYFSDEQRTATKDAGNIAGIDVIGIINEPTAAALAYGINKNDHQRIMVYDLGGGTFDVTIVETTQGNVRVLATHGNRNLGGFNFDNRLITYMSQEFQKATGIDISEDDEAMQVLRNRCETAKIALSSRDKYQMAMSAQGCKPVKLEITREKFEELIATLIDTTEDSILVTLKESGLSIEEIDKVLLVGGSTRIPAVRRFVESKMHQAPSCELNADEAVALGATIYANELAKKKDPDPKGDETKEEHDPEKVTSHISAPVAENAPVKIQDVNSHGLGIVCEDEQGQRFNSIILPRNSPIPTMVSKEGYYVDAGCSDLVVQITEGDEEDLDYVSVIGTANAHFRMRSFDVPVRIEMGYDQNGMIDMKIFDLQDGCYAGKTVIHRKNNMSADEVKKKRIRLSGEKMN